MLRNLMGWKSSYYPMLEEGDGAGGGAGAAGAAGGEGQGGTGEQGAGAGSAGSGTVLGGEGAGEGQGGSSWLDAVPEAHRESLKGYESWEKLVEAATKPVPVVPDEYKPPEGIEVNQEDFKAFAPLAKELGLTQEAVEKLVKYDFERAKGLPEQIMKRAADQMAEANANLAKEMGQEKYNGMVEQARLAMRTFGNEEIVKWLNDTGQGNNPVLIKMFSEIGAKLKEDAPKGAAAGGGGETDPAKILFPNMK